MDASKGANNNARPRNKQNTTQNIEKYGDKIYRNELRRFVQGMEVRVKGTNTILFIPK